MRTITIKLSLILLISLSMVDCGDKGGQHSNAPLDYSSPKALLITTGHGDGAGEISDGVIAALEALNSLGCPVRLENRSALCEPEILSQFNLLILPTLFGYHDVDRKFSLTFMDSMMMSNIKEWVHNGGTLIAGENIGRNRNDGSDRVWEDGSLNPQNWPLSEVFGIVLEEANLEGFQFQIDPSQNLGKGWSQDHSLFSIPDMSWALIPIDSLSGRNIIVWANWTGDRKYGGAVHNRFGKGNAIYLTSSLMLHPSIDGGLSNPAELKAFYKNIIQLPINESEAPLLGINAWPDGKLAALALTLGADGDEENLPAIIDSLTSAAGALTLFLRGKLTPSILDQISGHDEAEIASSGYSIVDFAEASFQSAREDIIKAELSLNKDIRGFRFSLLKRSYDGLALLHRRDYLYESSIVTNHRDYYGSALFPYNLPISKPGGEFYSTNVLELSPVYKDDWAFYGNGVMSPNYSIERQKKDAGLYAEYLNRFLFDVVKPVGGMMIQIGHAGFEGYSATTLEPVLTFARQARQSGDFWITNLSSIAEYWRMRQQINLEFSWDPPVAKCHISAPDGETLEGVTIKVHPANDLRLKEAVTSENRQLKIRLIPDGSFLVILDSPDVSNLKLIFGN